MPSRSRIAPYLIVSCLAAAPMLYGQEPPPGIPEALRIQPRDPVAAAKILEGVTAREPGNARAWRLLGAARQQSKQLDGAIDAYAKALALGPDRVALYNMGAAHALKGDAAAAFDWLAKAKAARFDMSRMEADADLASLRSDARYAALRPAAADFANPFVEDVKLLQEWRGEDANDQFGWIARAIGDVDGDGASDLVTSAPGHASGGVSAGRVYVYSSRTGKLLWKADGRAGDRLGTSLEAAGDINKDAIGDVVATAGSEVRVYSGRDGTVLLTLKSPGSLPLVSGAGAGDLNADGHPDVIAGSTPPAAGAAQAPAAQPPASPGAAYVFSGKDGTMLLTLSGERDGDRFGSAVAGDPSGSRPLLIVGAPAAGPARTGRTYVYTALTATPAFVIESDDTGGALGGMFVAAAGDADGDAVTDVYASDFANRAKGPSTGRVYVHSGKTGARLLTLSGEGPGEGFGTSASSAGDLDRDGHDDFAVGAWQYAAAAMSGGRIYLHSGKDGRLLGTITGRVPGDALGFDAVGIGDVDGDGTIDLLVTSASSAVNGLRSGRVFIVSSGITKAGR